MNQQPLQIRIYISNAMANSELAKRIRHELEANGFIVWSDDDLRIGETTFEWIRSSIEVSAAVIVLIDSEGESSLINLELAATELYNRPTVALETNNVGEIQLRMIRWSPSFSRSKAIVVGYDKSIEELIQGLNALRSYLERENALTLHLRITEDPLTAQNLTMIFSALTELSTKYWLIAKGRFADLIEYTQTHNGRFAEEANILVTRVIYNSPFNMDWKVDLSAPSVAEALIKTVDGIKQSNVRLEQAELENQKKVQEIKHAEQLSAHEQQMAVFEQEQKRLDIEQRRLEILEKQLEVQMKGIEYAMELASKMVDLLHPGADPATRAMEIQVLLPNLVQLQNGKGLELALPVSREKQTAPKQH